MTNAIVNNINDADFEYSIIVKKMDDILYDVTDDPTEQLIYDSIITGIENSAADAIRLGKVAQLPTIGCIRKSPIRKAIIENHDKLREAKQSMTTEQYKSHVREIIIDTRQTIARNEASKIISKRIRSKNKKKYDMYYITLGRAYAEMFIFSILALREVPYNLEVQEHFDYLNGI